MLAVAQRAASIELAKAAGSEPPQGETPCGRSTAERWPPTSAPIRRAGRRLPARIKVRRSNGTRTRSTGRPKLTSSARPDALRQRPWRRGAWPRSPISSASISHGTWSPRRVRAVLDQLGLRIVGINDTSSRPGPRRRGPGVRGRSERGPARPRHPRRPLLGLDRRGGAGGRAGRSPLPNRPSRTTPPRSRATRSRACGRRLRSSTAPTAGGPSHDDPDHANGSNRTLDDAREWPTSHPHCQRAFGPVVIS